MATETDTSGTHWEINPLKEFFASLHNDLKESIAERIGAVEQRGAHRADALAAQIEQSRKIVEARLDAMDKASVILSDNVTRVPTLLDRSLATLSQLTEEKFGGVQRQFAERDVRTDANQKSAETAVNAALSAQKEAVAQQNAAYAASGAKSEAATTKQIDSIVALLSSQSNALNDKIAAINSRLDRGDGGTSARAASQATLIAVASVIVSIIVGGYAIVSTRAAESAAATVLTAPAK